MCGRYTQTRIEERELKKRFNLTKVPAGLQPRCNVAPHQEVPAVLNETPEELSLVRRGLVPGWADEPKMKFSLINARAEAMDVYPVSLLVNFPSNDTPEVIKKHNTWSRQLRWQGPVL